MAETTKRHDSAVGHCIFVCSFQGCGKTFSRNDRLIIHLRTHTGEKPFVCEEAGCGKRYARPAHLKRHTETSHTKEKPVVKLKCTVEGCEQDFAHKLSLSRHIERIHQRKVYKCQFEGCDKTFRKNNQLKSHESEHTHINPYMCMVENCNKSFKTSSHLQRHQKVHQGYVCDENDCNEKFDKWTQLWKHKTVAHKQDFVCAICQKRFSQKNQLSQHLKTHEESREVFECPRENCSRVYLEIRNLKAHIRSYHDGQRHACPVEGCERTFASKQKLIQHSRLHDADRPPPKKKSKKGQKKKSMALKLAMLGLGETSAEDLMNLDKEKLRKMAGDSQEGSKSVTATASRSEPENAESVTASGDVRIPRCENNVDNNVIELNKQTTDSDRNYHMVDQDGSLLALLNEGSTKGLENDEARSSDKEDELSPWRLIHPTEADCETSLITTGEPFPVSQIAEDLERIESEQTGDFDKIYEPVSENPRVSGESELESLKLSGVSWNMDADSMLLSGNTMLKEDQGEKSPLMKATDSAVENDFPSPVPFSNVGERCEEDGNKLGEKTGAETLQEMMEET